MFMHAWRLMLLRSSSSLAAAVAWAQSQLPRHRWAAYVAGAGARVVAAAAMPGSEEGRGCVGCTTAWAATSAQAGRQGFNRGVSNGHVDPC